MKLVILLFICMIFNIVKSDNCLFICDKWDQETLEQCWNCSQLNNKTTLNIEFKNNKIITITDISINIDNLIISNNSNIIIKNSIILVKNQFVIENDCNLQIVGNVKIQSYQFITNGIISNSIGNSLNIKGNVRFSSQSSVIITIDNHPVSTDALFEIQDGNLELSGQLLVYITSNTPPKQISILKHSNNLLNNFNNINIIVSDSTTNQYNIKVDSNILQLVNTLPDQPSNSNNESLESSSSSFTSYFTYIKQYSTIQLTLIILVPVVAVALLSTLVIVIYQKRFKSKTNKWNNLEEASATSDAS
ncbi:RING zinc finger-containing protein [Tieghemostelium lacteum]|uniref:RING zinc finger-containing protein n=1 Tax=Tieghemostelium lacteum TaxID=361077 RepID=A0A152A7K7_TIELA|nr:RING zinc finger-containing protein [Tieghemostelium lacteum]|eukprot:KYR02037.1 RING zinc finger-containing protein [Tieghemostelium lacteum]